MYCAAAHDIDDLVAELRAHRIVQDVRAEHREELLEAVRVF